MLTSVVAIDGGGTKTSGVVVRQIGPVHPFAPAAGCNPQDGADWRGALGSVLEQIPDRAYAVLGIAGYGEVPKLDREIETFVVAQIGPNHLILNDVELAYCGAFPVGDGILLLSGTGSMAIGRVEKPTVRVGGWGYHFGDEGSAYWIGRQALARASFELDGRCQSDGFAARLSTALHADTHAFGLMSWMVDSTSTRAQIASIARTIDALAEQGDKVAIEILDSAAAHLVSLAQTAATRADFPQIFPWSMAGSVFHSKKLTVAVSNRLGRARPAAMSALGGGLALAATMAGWPADPVWTAQIATQTATIKK